MNATMLYVFSKLFFDQKVYILSQFWIIFERGICDFLGWCRTIFTAIKLRHRWQCWVILSWYHFAHQCDTWLALSKMKSIYITTDREFKIYHKSKEKIQEEAKKFLGSNGRVYHPPKHHIYQYWVKGSSQLRQTFCQFDWSLFCIFWCWRSKYWWKLRLTIFFHHVHRTH